MALVSVLMLGACGTGASGDITGSNDPGSEPRVSGPVPQNMGGTWIGTNQSVQLIWQLSQHGEDVTGTGQAIGSAWTGRNGRVEGKVTGSTFTFSETHPAGSLTVAGCSAELAGNLEVRTIQVQEHPTTTPPYYPPYYPPPNTPPQTITRTVMSGVVHGTACGTPFSEMLTIYRE
jgi:hypothetical protein